MMKGSEDLTPWIGKWVKVESADDGWAEPWSEEGWLRVGRVNDLGTHFHIATGQVNDGEDLAIFGGDTITLVQEIW